MMKKLVLLLFITLFNLTQGLSQSKTYEGGRYITSQTDLETLKGYTKIIGDLLIHGIVNSKDEITDLSVLSKLEEIEGGLQIVMTKVPDLKGLESLKTIKGDVYISYNSELTDTSSLSLTAIKSLALSFNTKLLSINLKNIKEVKALNIDNNNSLKNIELNNLTKVDFKFIIFSNENLKKLVLPSLSSVGGPFKISLNRNLSDCCSYIPLLNSENSIRGIIDISENKIGCNSKEEILNVCQPN